MSKEMNFVVFCIENYKLHRNLSGRNTLYLFEKYGVIEYLKEFYDILHTTGDEYINNDIDIYLQKRGYEQ